MFPAPFGPRALAPKRRLHEHWPHERWHESCSLNAQQRTVRSNASRFETRSEHAFKPGRKPAHATKDHEEDPTMRMATSLELYRYWDIVRAGRAAPRRFEIEPSDISEILPETFILEYAGHQDYRYRLAGTRICDQFAVEFRGRDFLADWSGADRITMFRRLRLIRERAAVLSFEFDASDSLGRTARFEAVILPLYHAAQRIDRLLGAITPVDPPAWLGETPIVARKLADFEVTWPEVSAAPAPRIQARPSAHELPADAMAPHVRHARIVRQDRRQFRVYDGGLVGTPHKLSGTD